MKPMLMSANKGFLGLSPGEIADASMPVVRIIPFGLERTVSYGGGTASGPAAMISASHQVELFDEELWCEPCRLFQVETLSEPEIVAGQEPALGQLGDLVTGALDVGAFPFIFGGEHAITPGALAPFVARFPDMALLHFDAHADLRDGYDGERFSHAAAIRRCMDAPGLEVVSIGIRNISAEEILFLDVNRDRLHLHFAKDIANWDIETMLAPLKGRSVYVTFDLDGFDSSLMPATGTPEPGGFFWADVMPILRAAAGISEIVGADINELAPAPGFHGCDFLAAKLAYKILSYRFIKCS